jgi:hypothetical protein
LLHQAEAVVFVPAFHDLATGEVVDVHARDRHLLAGRRHAPELAPVGAAGDPASRDVVPFGDELLVGDLQIGEGAEKSCEELPEGLAVQRTRHAGDVKGETGCEQLLAFV